MLGPGAIADLPLLQVPGHTVLPGVIQVMLISGPEWVHCFSELQALATEEAQPARFGHLRAYENIGVLMELREVRPLADGRLVVVARAICRFRVASSTALEPLPRANVILLPDDEELGLTRLRRETAASTDTCRGGAGGGGGGGAHVGGERAAAIAKVLEGRRVRRPQHRGWR